MGVELEGAWDTDFRVKAEEVKGARGKTDGSLSGMAGYMGEITTRPHSVLDHLCEDVKKLYPARVNETCGFHIHTSLNPFEYSCIMDKEFWKYYRDRWEAWGKAHESEMDPTAKRSFWERWHGRGHGGNRYCKAEFKPAEQMLDHNDRYTQLNFTAWHKYKTVESRLLPMFADAELACLAIRELSDIYDSFLNQFEFPKVTFETEFKVEGDVMVEEKKVKMPKYEAWAEDYEEKPYKAIPVGEDIYYNIPGATEYMAPFVDRLSREEP